MKFQYLIPQTVFGIGKIFCQHTGKFSRLFTHGKDCRIIVQKSDPDTTMLLYPGLFFASKTLLVIKCKILLIQICLEKRTVLIQLAHRMIQLLLDITALFIYRKIDA